MYLKPADYIIYVFQGVRAAAKAIGRSPSSITKWRQARKKRGLAGSIPTSAQKRILLVAKKEGLDINSSDLIYGRDISQEKVLV